jgi:mannose-1-phosphate guanylyltransferase
VDRNENVWALVLAAGEGSRLRALTMTSSGVHVPKQFCSLLNGPSLLQQALSRAQSIAPNERICTIVASQHHRWWGALPAANLIVQPKNCGTANGIMLALLHIAERDPNAQILLLPSDHHVREEPTLTESLRWALTHVWGRPHEVLLLGIEPEEPDSELGYIVPGDRDRDGTFEIAQFVEKPTVARARELIDNGALWNAFVIVASIGALLRVLEERVPQIMNDMREAVRKDLRCSLNALATPELYERLPSVDFSRDILRNGRNANLRVLPVPQCGWSDLGTSERVVQTLRQLRSIPRAIDASFGTNTFFSLAERLEGY